MTLFSHTERNNKNYKTQLCNWLFSFLDWSSSSSESLSESLSLFLKLKIEVSVFTKFIYIEYDQMHFTSSVMLT
jgi:hypothetical protein